MDFNIAVLPGDGVGPEVVAEGVKVLQAVGKKFGRVFSFHYGDIGGVVIDKTGVAIEKGTIEMCHGCDAVLLGAVGGPKWDDPLAEIHPEDGLLALRKELGVFANIRPVKVSPTLANSTTLKAEVIRDVDFIFIRELTGGIYFGKPKGRWQSANGREAVDTLAYSEQEILRTLRVGFELALNHGRKITSVDKANVLETSKLWRQIAIELSWEYPDVELEHMLVDTCAMKLIQSPSDFDVIVTENMFGDILTDEASVLAGSMGMLPSASLAEVPKRISSKAFGLYEPIHGSAPDIAGQNIANPLATILSCAMMLRYSLGLTKEADIVEKAVDIVLEKGYRTADIANSNRKKVGTREMGNLIVEKIEKE